MIGKPFEKGKSGNPSGRPRIVSEIRELAQKHGLEAFQRVLDLTRSGDERIAFQASQEVLNRAYGKPPQAMTGEDGQGPIKLEISWAGRSASSSHTTNDRSSVDTTTEPNDGPQ